MDTINKTDPHKTPLDVFIIALSGKMGVGKDHIMSNYIVPLISQPCSHMAFADQIKINLASRLDLPIEQCLASEKSTDLRRALQDEGTRLGRESVHPDIWIRTLENWIRLRLMRDGQPNVILITDCRFTNEAEWVLKNNGLLIRINAPTRNQQRLEKYPEDQRQSIVSHISETCLDNYKFEYVIDNEPDQSDHLSLTIQLDNIINKYLSCHLNHVHYFV